MLDQDRHLFARRNNGKALRTAAEAWALPFQATRARRPNSGEIHDARHDQHRMTRERHLHRRPPQQVARVLALLDHRQILQAAGMYDKIGGVALAGQPVMRDTGTVAILSNLCLAAAAPHIRA